MTVTTTLPLPPLLPCPTRLPDLNQALTICWISTSLSPRPLILINRRAKPARQTYLPRPAVLAWVLRPIRGDSVPGTIFQPTSGCLSSQETKLTHRRSTSCHRSTTTHRRSTTTRRRSTTTRHRSTTTRRRSTTTRRRSTTRRKVLTTER